MKTRSTILMAVLLVLACFALLPGARAVSPAPDGCYPNFTTAEGCDALSLLTTGAGNTALGWRSLFSDSTGSFNTGVGAGALVLDTGDSNTAVGAVALLLNTTGAQNTAVGTDTLVFNDSGTGNTAIGYFALMNGTGSGNTAVGGNAGDNVTSGNDNLCVGAFSGTAITTGNNIITIGPVSGVHSVFGQVDDTTYIANILGATVDVNTAQQVYVDSDGRLGTVLASAGPEPRLPGAATPKADPDAQAMLNKVEELQATITQQQQQIETLTARLKEQAAQIEKASTQLAAASPSGDGVEMSKPVAKLVVNKP